MADQNIVPENSPEAELWDLLDSIDTFSDMIKPTDEKGYKMFYEETLKEAEKRHRILRTDGYKLYYKMEE